MNDEINLPENEMISAQTMKYLLDRESARHERTVKRLIISYTVILLLIIGSIIYFVVTSDDYHSREAIRDVAKRLDRE